MAFDLHNNFAYSLVATAPSPADTGISLTVTTGEGAKFPAAPFNVTIWPANTQPSTTNAEIARVVYVSGDVFTITRAQESTTARSVLVGDQIAETITAKVITDIENAIPAEVTPQETLDLLTYAFTRIKFLEDALGIEYQSDDIVVPDSYSLLEVDL